MGSLTVRTALSHLTYVISFFLDMKTKELRMNVQTSGSVSIFLLLFSKQTVNCFTQTGNGSLVGKWRAGCGRSKNIKVCSFWSCAFLGLCSSEHTCARESTFFISPRISSFWAINSFLKRLIFPPMYFTKSRKLLMRWRRMHMTTMNRLYNV